MSHVMRPARWATHRALANAAPIRSKAPQAVQEKCNQGQGSVKSPHLPETHCWQKPSRGPNKDSIAHTTQVWAGLSQPTQPMRTKHSENRAPRGERAHQHARGTCTVNACWAGDRKVTTRHQTPATGALQDSMWSTCETNRSRHPNRVLHMVRTHRRRASSIPFNARMLLPAQGVAAAAAVTCCRHKLRLQCCAAAACMKGCQLYLASWLHNCCWPSRCPLHSCHSCRRCKNSCCLHVAPPQG